jgi:hypothetical protein
MNAQLKPVAPHRPAAAAFAAHLAALAAAKDLHVKPTTALAKIQAQLSELLRRRKELEDLRGQYRAARTAEHLGEPVSVDVPALDKRIKVLHDQVTASADDETALHQASADLQGQLAQIHLRLQQLGAPGPALKHALYRERILEQLPDFVAALEPALEVWSKILALGDAADDLRKGENAGLVQTAIGVTRDLPIPRLNNLPGYDDMLLTLLKPALERAQASAQRYIRRLDVAPAGTSSP